MANFRITRKVWGRPVNEGELRDAIERVMGPSLKRAALAIQRTEMQATPVKTGHLRRGWTVGTGEWRGQVYRVPVGNAVIYARRVNKVSRKNAGYVERGLSDGRTAALSIAREGVRQLAHELWKRQNG